jgi:hypothetical protein
VLLAGSLDQFATLENATTLAFAASAPHTVFDALIKGVIKALAKDRASFADCTGAIDAHTI